MERTASCCCGQLTVRLSREPRGVGICHCLDCQRRTGSAFAYLARFEGPYEVSGEATEYRRSGDAGASFTFRFCPRCGSTVYKTEDGVEGSVSIPVGALADPDFPAPTVSVYASRQHRWLQLPAEIRVYQTDP